MTCYEMLLNDHINGFKGVSSLFILYPTLVARIMSSSLDMLWLKRSLDKGSRPAAKLTMADSGGRTSILSISFEIERHHWIISRTAKKINQDQRRLPNGSFRTILVSHSFTSNCPPVTPSSPVQDCLFEAEQLLLAVEPALEGLTCSNAHVPSFLYVFREACPVIAPPATLAPLVSQQLPLDRDRVRRKWV